MPGLTSGSRWLSASDPTGKNLSLVPTPAGVAAPSCSHPPAAPATPPGSGEPDLGSDGVAGAQPPATCWDPSRISDPGDRHMLGRPASHPHFLQSGWGDRFISFPQGPAPTFRQVRMSEGAKLHIRFRRWTPCSTTQAGAGGRGRDGLRWRGGSASARGRPPDRKVLPWRRG